MPELEKILARIDSGREYRKMEVAGLELRTGDTDEDLIVEGYATTFNEPYELWRERGFVVMEQVDSHAFDNCDMSDVIFQFNHSGRVFARTRNKTLELTVDAHGLRVRAHLGGTEIGRQLYEEIKGGYIDRMSFGFTVERDSREVTEDAASGVTTVLRTLLVINKLYDTSCVDFPANDGTDISARNYSDGVIAEIREAAALAAEEKQRLETKREEIRARLRKHIQEEP